jgi:hypothetical protein
MRQVLLGLLGVLAAGAACAEEYSFSAIIQGVYPDKTIIQCDGPRVSGRVPTSGCTLLERAVAYPNHKMPHHSNGVACAAGHPIEFYANGTLAACVLDVEQPVDVTGLAFTIPLGDCRGLVRFDKDDGRVEC